MINQKALLLIKNITLALIACILFTLCSAQTGEDNATPQRYRTAFHHLQTLLENNGKFKDAVFVYEDCYFENQLDRNDFDSIITSYCRLIERIQPFQLLEKRRRVDSINLMLNFQIGRLFKDTITAKTEGMLVQYPPLTFNFADPLGKKDWSNMFVIKLLGTHVGNCHSMSYLYKILADELNATCWLALAPNHIYIRNRDPKLGWYNTELTSGAFPTDAWIMTTGYVSADAVRSGIYMDTLSNQQSIALCVLDLAKGYERQMQNYEDGFILQCCELVLQYHPANPMALLLKAETLKKLYAKKVNENNRDWISVYPRMEEAYIGLAKLNYREMPERMYLQWLKSINGQGDQYTNKRPAESIRVKKN